MAQNKYTHIDDRGQSLVEFLLLLVLVLGLSFSFLRLSHEGVGTQWKYFVALITAPNPSSPDTGKLRFNP